MSEGKIRPGWPSWASRCTGPIRRTTRSTRWWCTHGVARTSGQLPRIDGELTCLGRLGDTVTVEEGTEAAAVCALNALAVLEQALGSLDRIERVLTVTGFVSSAPDFHQQPAVVDGASKVLADVFGEAGRHTRSAIGVAALPRNGAVEIEVTVAVSD
jgi:enamine deaminase RidA (YjgF/YER057c/UK114 family)